MKTYLGHLFAVSTLTAFIATSIPSVSAVALSPAPHVARHLTQAHMAKVKRNMNKKRCIAKVAPGSDSGGSSSGSSSGGTSVGSVGSSLFSHKKGLAFPNGCDKLVNWRPETMGWHYNWRATPYGDCPGGIPPYIPMVWGWSQVGDFNNAVNANWPSIVFFLNEPDLCNNGDLSSCVSPQDACTIWWQTVASLQSRGVKVGSSGTTSAPAGLQWEKDFRSYCNVKPDFITAHYYGTSWQDFINYANGWYNAFGQGVVFTEVGCQDFNNGPQCSYDQIITFIQQITHWCLATDWCWGITFFGAMLDMVNVNTMNQLMDGNYNPNYMGDIFLDAA